MRTYRKPCVLALVAAVAAFGATLRADVKTQEKSLVKFGGALGKVVSMFGGKGAREGVVSTVALKGNRLSRTTNTSQEIIDLDEEKIYKVDLNDKSYTVVTFAELRKQMESAREKAAEREPEKADEKPATSGEKQYEVDFDLKDTGQTKTINGQEARETVMTITVREKGKTLDESGGVVLTADSWLGPEVPEMKELAEFQARYAQKLYGGLMTPETAQQMAAALAAHPALKDAMARYQKEKVNFKGTPLSTVVTFDAVQSKAQAAESAKQSEEEDEKPSGGLFGSVARKIAKKKASDDADKPANSTPGRATIMTMTNDVLKIEPSATAEDVAVPAGFKQKS